MSIQDIRGIDHVVSVCWMDLENRILHAATIRLLLTVRPRENMTIENS